MDKKDRKDRKEYQREYQKNRIANETPEEREKRLAIIREYRKRNAEYFKAYQRQYHRKKYKEEGNLSAMSRNAVSLSREKSQRQLLAVSSDKIKMRAKINYNGRELQIAQIDVKLEGEDWFSPCECCIYGYRSYYNKCSVKRYNAEVFNCQNRQFKEEPCKGGERWVFVSDNNIFNEPQFHLQLDRAYIEAGKKI